MPKLCTSCCGSWQDTLGNTVISQTYDSAGGGGVTNDGDNTYLYDGEGRLCATQGQTVLSIAGAMMGYLYDAEGRRVAKGTLTAMSCDLSSNGFTATAAYIIGPNGEQMTELDGSGNWVHTNAYANGQLLATYDTPGLHFQFADWLGSRRVQTNPAGAVEQTCTGLPFGDTQNCTLTSMATADDATEHHFTGQERDTESGNDYFIARFYQNTLEGGAALRLAAQLPPTRYSMGIPHRELPRLPPPRLPPLAPQAFMRPLLEPVNNLTYKRLNSKGLSASQDSS
jgi:hypothetical protein